MTMPRSIALRLTLALAAISLVIFSATAVALHQSLANQLARASHVELMGKIALVKRFIDDATTSHGLVALREHLDWALVEQPDLRVWIEASDGRMLYGGPMPRVVERFDSYGHLGIVRDDGVAMEAMEEELVPDAALPVSRVLVAFETRGRDRLLAGYRDALIAVSAAAVLLSGALGAFAAWRSLEPVKRLSREAARITPRSLGTRLSDERVADELAGLVHSFNSVVDRLEAAYRQMEAFNADVAHELRTPLASLIGGNQVVLSRPRANAELRETLAANLEDLSQLNAMINDMLFLARADRGETAEALQPVELAEEADKTLEFCEALIEEAGLRATRQGSARAMCNPPLIRRALANLVTNAAKHTLPGGSIAIDIEARPGRVRLSVFNPGTPIPPEVARRMFDRFYRGDEARRDSGESHGLGLAIVHAIARMHGGSTFMEPGCAGNRVGFEIAVNRPDGDDG